MPVDPVSRTADLRVFDQLFELHESFFGHVLQCSEMLASPELAPLCLPVSDLGLAAPAELAARFNLIKKYRQEVSSLSKFYEINRIYTTLARFLEPSLVDLQRCFGEKEARFAVRPGNELKTDNHNFLCYFVNYFFPGDQLTRVAKFLRGSASRASTCPSSREAVDAILRDTLDMFSELSFETDIFSIKYNLDKYAQLYPHRSAEPKQAEMFKLSIMKELAFDPSIDDEFEANYENSILRRILDKEMNSSPNTFDESQQKILDLMEIVTFHIDSIPRVFDLVLQFLELLALKNLPLENKSTKAYMPNYCHDYRKMVQKWIADATALSDTMVEQGTIKLSYRKTFFELGHQLQIFHISLRNFLNFTMRLPANNHFYKDESHFYEQISSYSRLLARIVDLIRTHYTDPISLRNNKFAEFEAIDYKIKDAFFDLHHFHQRFQYERKISRIFHEVQPP